MSRVTLCLGWGMRRLTATISFMTAFPHFEKRKRLHYCPLEGAGNFSNPEDHLSACHQDLPPSSGPCALARPPAHVESVSNIISWFSRALVPPRSPYRVHQEAQ